MGFMRAIRAALPDDGIYVEEVTQVGFVSRLAFPVYAPRTFLSPGYQDTLGWGYGTALGAQAASPGRKVVLATGDGGFMYQSAELATANAALACRSWSWCSTTARSATCAASSRTITATA